MAAARERCGEVPGPRRAPPLRLAAGRPVPSRPAAAPPLPRPAASRPPGTERPRS